MMTNQTFVVTGLLTDGRIVKLDETLPLETTRVRVSVEPLPTTRLRPYRLVIAEIRQRQRARSFTPPTRAQIDSYLHQEQSSWNE